MAIKFGEDPIPGFASTKNLEVLKAENAFLKILNGPNSGCLVPLNSLKMLIGRNDPPRIIVEIDLTSFELGEIPMISRKHAECKWVDNKLEIIDLGSSNGTFVEGKRIPSLRENKAPQPVQLNSGSRVRFANLECEIVISSLSLNPGIKRK
ncbi:MAG: FHA domain-containing protein [Candidatus Riflebacteria bacterium]|nr:FHA domain-containing protein [Candidatus Riflebacteria bacterium]